ncbi:uncharacterized protein LOC119550363 isoform X3 [Drosophila subpulchrella]|uniref:uncharacterized protein LOC119550363 isoform X3 n=1 Tax=Drosophila subpulchrella TaxID=1486046 RepID=UPI0018A138C0|nr:uncharacterized protein LOC119550363 isoform X3 [Drosophila subpulchrella]
MWSEPGAVLAGGTIGVFCRCNSSTVRIQDLSMVNWLNYTVKTQPFDEFTIMFKKENVDMHFQVHWYCRYQKTEVSKYRVAIVPLIHIEELKCNFQPNETGLSCDFSEEGYAKYGGEKSYFLSVNQISRVHCLKKTLSTTIQCPSLPLNRTTNQYKLRIDMEYKGYNQKKEFQLGFKQVLAPEWPTGRLHISLDHTIHLWWSGTDYSAQNLEWRVWFLPRNPEIQKHFVQRKVRFSAVPMMKIYQLTSPSYAYQAYKMIISRRYPFWDSPWSSEIETPEFVTEAKLPDRPPDILPNGFFYDPKKQNLYVYWRQLDELKINGPNFTYYAITDRGRQ